MDASIPQPHAEVEHKFDHLEEISFMSGAEIRMRPSSP